MLNPQDKTVTLLAHVRYALSTMLGGGQYTVLKAKVQVDPYSTAVVFVGGSDVSDGSGSGDASGTQVWSGKLLPNEFWVDEVSAMRPSIDTRTRYFMSNADAVVGVEAWFLVP